MEEAEGSNSKRKRPPERWLRRELRGHNRDQNSEVRLAGNTIARFGNDHFRQTLGHLPKWQGKRVRTFPQNDLPSEAKDKMPQSSQSQHMADDEMDDIPQYQPMGPADMAWDDEDEVDPNVVQGLLELPVRDPAQKAYVQHGQYDREPDIEIQEGELLPTPTHSPSPPSRQAPSSISPPPLRHLPAHQRPRGPLLNGTTPDMYRAARGLQNGQPPSPVGREGPYETVINNTLHPYGRQGPAETLVNNGLAFHQPSAWHHPTRSCTGFQDQTGNRTDWGIKGRQRNFAPRIMDIVIFERLDAASLPGSYERGPSLGLFPSTQDAKGRLKQTSKVRFNTVNLTCPAAGPGDMVLRIGQLWEENRGRHTIEGHDRTSRVKFHLSPTIELYEAVWEETSQRGLVRETLVWEETSHIEDHLMTEDRSPWEWRFLRSDQPLRSGDSSRISPNTVYNNDMSRCLLLRRKKGGAHDHDCQKLDWYPPSIAQRNFLLQGDYLVRFGVMDLIEDLDSPEDTPHVLACVEAWSFCGRSSLPAGQLNHPDHQIRRGNLRESAGWIFLGRDECWMKGQQDIGLKGKRIIPQAHWVLSEFVPKDEWPRGNPSLTVLH